ncbi:MAG: flavin reductase [Saprospiraceae bacterium]|nr:flavin reductase [Saprospiraceae bacterium]
MKLVKLDTGLPIWDHFFTVAPLVIIGTKEGNGYDLAPKHMVTALGKGNYFGFVCTPRHRTYQNIRKEPFFTVSFPKPEQVVVSSMASMPRCGQDFSDKPIIYSLPTFSSDKIDALFVEDGYLYLDCELHEIFDGFGDYSLITGKIISAQIESSYQRVSDQDEMDMVYRNPLLVYLANGRFAEIRNTKSFPFPKNFRL